MRKYTRFTAALFIAFLAVMFLGTVLVSKEPFSQTEKRYLAEFPTPSWESVASASWGQSLEIWLADHIPARNFFVGLDAYKEYFLGQQAAKEIRVIDGRLVEAPASVDDGAVDKSLSAIRGFAQATGSKAVLALVPSAGWAMGAKGYRDGEIIADIYEKSGVDTLDLTGCFAGKPELFYKTDHHWTSAGAYAGYEAIAARFGRDAAAGFTREVIPGFQGSTYSRSALWLTKAEELELWHSGTDITVTVSDAEGAQEVFDREKLEQADKYTVFLGGNHPLVRLRNPNQEGRLLVIRDSYSNCLGPFLAESYGEVVLVDLRYYRLPVSRLTQEEEFDDILILYSLGNFLSDPNLVLLR